MVAMQNRTLGRRELQVGEIGIGGKSSPLGVAMIAPLMYTLCP